MHVIEKNNITLANIPVLGEDLTNVIIFEPKSVKPELS